MKKCSCSGSVQSEKKRIDIDWSINREIIQLNMEVPTCASCQEVILSKDVEDLLRQEALKLYKKRHGLMSGKEIYHIRTNVLKMSRKKFADYVGTSHLSVWDWEKKNRPQGKSVDELIRIKSSPEYIEKHLVKRVHI